MKVISGWLAVPLAAMTFFCASTLVSVPEKLFSAWGAWLATGITMSSSMTVVAAARVSKFLIAKPPSVRVDVLSIGKRYIVPQQHRYTISLIALTSCVSQMGYRITI